MDVVLIVQYTDEDLLVAGLQDEDDMCVEMVVLNPGNPVMMVLQTEQTVSVQLAVA